MSYDRIERALQWNVGTQSTGCTCTCGIPYYSIPGKEVVVDRKWDRLSPTHNILWCRSKGINRALQWNVGTQSTGCMCTCGILNQVIPGKEVVVDRKWDRLSPTHNILWCRSKGINRALQWNVGTQSTGCMCTCGILNQVIPGKEIVVDRKWDRQAESFGIGFGT